MTDHDELAQTTANPGLKAEAELREQTAAAIDGASDIAIAAVLLDHLVS